MFRVYYGDGQCFEGSPEAAPTDNVQAIAWNDPDESIGDCGRIVLHGWDIYIYSDHVGSWHGTNKYADLLMHLGYGCGAGGVRAVLRGCWIDYELFKKIKLRAESDPALNRRTGCRPNIEDGSE